MICHSHWLSHRSEDKIALTKLSVSNQHASYLNTHGLDPEFRQRLSEKLKKKKAMFSMKVVEAINLNITTSVNK